MATIHIDNHPYKVADDQNLLQACLSLGMNVPYFCWHPAMGSVGACRQCAVKQFKDEHDTRGRIVMACMTPVAEGMRVSIDHPDARAFRRAVIEWLMLNHPHDCPVCDEGGECHLQDMTVMTGHVHRRTRFAKRTHRNQDLGPFVTHEMNRCIQCYRCVRFYREFAGGRDFDVFGWHDHVYFGRHEDGPLRSHFAGNLVEICPTGVFTDKSLYSHYTRKWDLQVAPSVCVHCGLGCNTIPGERYGLLRRIRARFNRQVNGYFLCDRGRYGYEFVNSPARVRQTMLRKDRASPLEPADTRAALAAAAPMLADKARVLAVASPRASLESNYALCRLADRVHAAMPPGQAALAAAAIQLLRRGPARSPSLDDLAHADAVLVLGDDPCGIAPMAALALRQAALEAPMAATLAGFKIPRWHDAAARDAIGTQRGPFFVCTPAATGLDDIATETLRADPSQIADLAAAVAARLGDKQAPRLPAERQALADRIATALKGARRPLIITGIGLGSRAVLDAAAGVANSLCTPEHAAELAVLVPHCNTMGLAMLMDSHESNAVPPTDVCDARAVLRAFTEGSAHTLLVLEADLYRAWDAELVEAIFAAAGHVIVLDHTRTPTADRADLLLPAATFAESDGTMVNSEGRAQRFFQVFVPQEAQIADSWRWLGELSCAPHGPRWSGLDAVLAELAASATALAGAVKAAPDAAFRLMGQRVPRQTHRFSGRTAIDADRAIHEPRPPADHDSPLSFSMEGSPLQPPAALAANFWAPQWNSVQAINKFQQEVGGPLRGGPSGARLLEPHADAKAPASPALPAPPELRPGQVLLVGAYHAMGSDELSAAAPGISHLAPPPYVAMRDPAAAGLAPGERAEIVVERGEGRTTVLEATVRTDSSLPAHVAAVPAGILKGAEALDLPRAALLRAARGGRT